MLSFSNDALWQDNEVRFDAPHCDLMLRNGEKLFKLVENVEDVKGNNGEKGKLYITNLRLFWIAKSARRNSLSIGFSCIINISNKNVNSKAFGKSLAAVVLTKFCGTRYEFIFTEYGVGGSKLMEYITTVYKLYDSTRIYRELRVRGAFMKGNSLVLLPLETLFDEVEGVWNLSSDQGNLGKLMLTSIRLVWTSIMNENFNISVPFLQIQMVATRNSKFGEALVVQTTRKAGSYLLGFRIDPPESLHNTVKQLGSLHNIYMKSPNFGIAISRAKDEVRLSICKHEIHI
ncbi:Bardet-Biedl syndrome 5 protein like [Schistosoma japonicum]|nr:Bardet-Biedl syndrome 5 protein like [Schistosoma japonicum]